VLQPGRPLGETVIADLGAQTTSLGLPTVAAANAVGTGTAAENAMMKKWYAMNGIERRNVNVRVCVYYDLVAVGRVYEDRLLLWSLHGKCLQMECMLEAFPPQVLLDLSCAVVQTHTEKRSRTQLLVD
jgi:hypothetical protein